MEKNEFNRVCYGYGNTGYSVITLIATRDVSRPMLIAFKKKNKNKKNEKTAQIFPLFSRESDKNGKKKQQKGTIFIYSKR